MYTLVLGNYGWISRGPWTPWTCTQSWNACAFLCWEICGIQVFLKRVQGQIELRTTFLDSLTSVFGEIGSWEDYFGTVLI